MAMALLGVNVDHVATVRNARGTIFPDPVKAALIAEENGADGITAHLREDRRHIKDEDMFRLKSAIKTRLNMEMANTEEMVAIALELKPYMVTLVPERREELTTEGGLDVAGFLKSISQSVETLQSAGILVSLFIEPTEKQIRASHASGARIVEFHTGIYCDAFEKAKNDGKTELEINEAVAESLEQLLEGARLGAELGLEINAGHGLNCHNVAPVLAMNNLNELNIGHSLIADSIFDGMAFAVKRMKTLIS